MSTAQDSNKPMAISSITSPPLPNVNLMISTLSSKNRRSHHSHHRLSSPYPSAAPSPPESPTYQKSMNHYHHQPHYLQQHRNIHPYYSSSSSNHHQGGYPLQNTYNSISSIQQQSLSLKERRQRNKVASAKYRAKKNQQHGEMGSLISSLTKENDLLQRQLEHVRRENYRLKATCDKLRGKILAEKMLKKLLNGSKEEEYNEDQDLLMEQEEDRHHDSGGAIDINITKI